MVKVVVTGANGFIAKNLIVHLKRTENISIESIVREDTSDQVKQKLEGCDIVYHLAGVNRPESELEFQVGNVELTDFLLKALSISTKPVKFIMSSSIQAELDNPYGKSKREAENIVKEAVKDSNIDAVVFRLPGVFGKWCKPNYNSVVATFCHNIANDIPIQINNPETLLTITYVDDVVASFLGLLNTRFNKGSFEFKTISVVYSVTLQQLSDVIYGFKNQRTDFYLPEVNDFFLKKLYSTYLTYLPEGSFSYPLFLRSDDRGTLFELLKSKGFGQIFISSTHPGVTRGNHFHHTKTEKFCVISGSATIRFRKIDEDKVIDYDVSGVNPVVVDIPPGYTHNITNTGNTELITLFWANEIFNSETPDTFFEKV